jgi:CrcB protein
MSPTPDPLAIERKPSHTSQVSDHEFHLDRTRSIVGSALVHHESVDDALSLASVDRPPSVKDGMPPSQVYHPLSLPVLALLMPASILGVLARLGLEALATYDGQSIFPLAYVQAVGCLIMGFGVATKEPIGRL